MASEESESRRVDEELTRRERQRPRTRATRESWRPLLRPKPEMREVEPRVIANVMADALDFRATCPNQGACLDALKVLGQSATSPTSTCSCHRAPARPITHPNAGRNMLMLHVSG